MVTKQKNYEQILRAICADDRYRRNLDWGTPRLGHPEGTVRAHIAELEQNLDQFKERLTDEEYWKLRILIHTHDTFKAEARRGVAIRHRMSHSSLAARFLVEHCGSDEIVPMAQLHDEPFALHRQQRKSGTYSEGRLLELLATITNWDLFAAFLIIDGCTTGKRRDPLVWFLGEIRELLNSRFGIDDLL